MSPAMLRTLRESLPERPAARRGRPATGGNGWTQRAFAERLGLNLRTYEHYESSRGVISTDIMQLVLTVAEQITDEADNA